MVLAQFYLDQLPTDNPASMLIKYVNLQLIHIRPKATPPPNVAKKVLYNRH